MTGKTLQTLSWKKLYLSRAKLKAISQTSAFLAGFAMVAMVEIDLPPKAYLPGAMLVVFSACTTCLVAVHLFALMISTCILPHIDVINSLNDDDYVKESPHERMSFYIDLAWILSTVIGTMLSLLEIALICWIRFYPYNNKPAAITSTSIVLPCGLVFVVFAVHFYRTLVVQKVERQFEELAIVTAVL